MKLEVEIVGASGVVRNLTDMAERARDVRPAARSIRDLLQQGFGKQITSRGSYFGTPWPPLSGQTVRLKGNDTPGVDSGDMRDALTGKGRGAKTSATRTQVLAGTSLFYARFFAKRRPIVDVTAGDLREANAILRRYITEGHS